MKARILISAVLSLSALTACGGSDTGGANADATYSLQSGTFAVSNVKALDNDRCNLVAAYQAAGAKITVTNTSGLVALDVPTPSRPSNEDPPSATLDGNDLITPTPAHYTSDLADGCQLLVDEVVSGQLTADDTLSMKMDVTLSDGSDTPGSCTAQDANASKFPCSSSITFTAKRTGP